MLCSSSIARVRSPIAGVHFQKAAAPKMMRVLMWPVRPKGCSGITGLVLSWRPYSKSANSPAARFWNRRPL